MTVIFVLVFVFTLIASVAEAVVEKDFPRDIAPFCVGSAALLVLWIYITS